MSEYTVPPPAESNRVNEHTRWNFITIIAESTSFQTGRAWVDPSSVLPLFITALTPSTTVVGLIPVLQRLGFLLPQLPVAALVGHRPRRAPFLRWGVFFGRLPFLIFVAYLFLNGIGNPALTIAFLMISMFSVHGGNGFVAVPWQDIIAKSIPVFLRGRFWGTLMFSHSVGGFAVGFAVRYLLGPAGPEFPDNYFLCFLFAAILFTGSTIGCALVREPIRPVLEQPDRLRDVVAAIGPMLRDRPEFRSLVIVGLFGLGIAFSLPFYIVYATTQLGVPDYMAGIYISASTLGAAVFSIIWGRLNDSRGPRALLRAGCACVFVTPISALLVPEVCRFLTPIIPQALDALPYAYSIIFVIGRAAMIALFMGTINYVFEIADDQQRPRTIGVFNTLSAPGALLPLLIGWALDYVSYVAVFSVLAAAGLGTWLVSLRMADPRARLDRAAGSQ